VNTTPVGTVPEVTGTPVPAGSLDGGRTVYDLVYNPGTTRLLREAAAAGCDTIGGLDMLVSQAVRQFEWWVGSRPSERLFKTAALSVLKEQWA
jgi:shikimate 5-dehydrogenase